MVYAQELLAENSYSVSHSRKPVSHSIICIVSHISQHSFFFVFSKVFFVESFSTDPDLITQTIKVSYCM